MGYYSSMTVPPVGGQPEPSLQMFTRQTTAGVFTEWMFNAIVDNVELLASQFPPFYISGCDLTYGGYNPEGFYEWNVSAGLVFTKSLTYVQADMVQVGYLTEPVVIYVTPQGTLERMTAASWDPDTAEADGLCRIGIVFKNRVVSTARSERLAELRKLPLTQAYYDAINYYDSFITYG